MPAIQPSPALIVTSDTRVDECVRKMRDHNVGSLLVVSYQRPYPLLGIFTERDVLNKFDELQIGGHWGKAVAIVMKKPVITVGITELEDAPEIMLKNGFRHLPVVYEDEDGETHVAGVISMRDLFRGFVERNGAAFELPEKRLKVGILVGKEDRFGAFQNVFETKKRAIVTRLQPATLAVQAPRVDFVFVDLDGYPPKNWSKTLEELGRMSQVKVFLLFTPGEHSPEVVKSLEKLSKTERFAPFAKPVNVLELLGQLNRWKARK